MNLQGSRFDHNTRPLALAANWTPDISTLAASSGTYPAKPPNRNLMAFGEVLGFASAIFPSVWAPLSRTVRLLSQRGGSAAAAGARWLSVAGTSGDTKPGTRSAEDQSGGENEECRRSTNSECCFAAFRFSSDIWHSRFCSSTYTYFFISRCSFLVSLEPISYPIFYSDILLILMVTFFLNWLHIFNTDD